MKDNDTLLHGQSKPTIEQAAWVVSHLTDSMVDGGTFRYLIYDRMGYGPEAYMPMLEAGAMAINNAFCELEEYRAKEAQARETDGLESGWAVDGLMLRVTQGSQTDGTDDVT
jgi:hypothetical protein